MAPIRIAVVLAAYVAPAMVGCAAAPGGGSTATRTTGSSGRSTRKGASTRGSSSGGGTTGCGVSAAGPSAAALCAAPSFAAPTGYTADGVSVVAADLTGDGQPDLVLAGVNNETSLAVLFNEGGGTFGAAVLYAAPGTHLLAAAVGDLNGDGLPDIAAAAEPIGAFDAGGVTLLFAQPDHTFIFTHWYAVGSDPVSLALGDFNGDGRPDIATADQASDTMSVLLNAGDGGFADAVAYPSGASPQSVVVGDFNGDCRLDLATVSSLDASLEVYFNGGLGTFDAATVYSVGPNTVPVALAEGDFNRDGQPDLVTANSGNDTVSVFLNQGQGAFGAQATYVVGTSPQAVAVGDVNGDGWPDLVVANQGDGSLSVLLNQGDGTFGSQTQLDGGLKPTGVALADFTGDGLSDIAAAVGSETSGLVVLLNQCDR